jgi:hypothetical protein
VELENYLTEEFAVGETAAAFIFKHAPIFLQTTPDDIPLLCFDAYQEYQALFQQKVETFCSDRNVEHRKFLDWCRLGLEGVSESEGGSREFLEILLAADDFTTFYELMTTTVNTMQLQQLRQQQQQQQQQQEQQHQQQSNKK